jgi:predicted permease
LDGQVLGFTTLVVLFTGLIFGLAPAFQTTRASLHDTLKEGGRSSGAAAGPPRLRNILVVSEVALALLLLVGAGLCYKGFDKAHRINPGFDPRNVLVGGLRLGAHGYDEPSGKVFYHRLLERLKAIPGVESAGLASWFPLGFEGGPGTGVRADGYVPHPNEDLGSPYSIISSQYFETMRIPLLEGRDFADQDDDKSPAVAIINEAMAKRYWAGQSPIGRTIRIWDDHPFKVSGVVKNGKYRGLAEPQRPFLYLHYRQVIPDLNLGVIMRTSGDPALLASALRQAVQAVDSRVAVWGTLTMVDYISAAYLPQKITATLLIVLGLLALLLAAIGLYGVMAYVVSQRTHEIGIRMALGAQAMDVLKMVVKQGMTLTSFGAGVGLIGALAVTHLLARFLYGVSPFDPITFIGVTLLLGVVTLIACYVPARRATKVDPMITLRYE